MFQLCHLCGNIMRIANGVDKDKMEYVRWECGECDGAREDFINWTTKQEVRQTAPREQLKRLRVIMDISGDDLTRFRVWFGTKLLILAGKILGTKHIHIKRRPKNEELRNVSKPKVPSGADKNDRQKISVSMHTSPSGETTGTIVSEVQS